MPPKPKFTKVQVLEMALKIVREQGEEALTARNLGAALGSSTRPLFTLFKSMDEIKSELLLGSAIDVFNDFCIGFKDYSPAFKRFGLMLVEFAEVEPHLFSFLFINKHVDALTLEQWSHTRTGQEALRVLMLDYEVDEATAKVLFCETWLLVFSICVLKVTGTVVLTDQEISDSLSRHFIGLLTLAKSGRLMEQSIDPGFGEMPNGMNVGDILNV